MYCTGDLGRIMADSDGNPGEMEFIGRIDNQVKVRGFRIELGEIQSCLLSHESVNSAIVIVKEQPEHVAAYVVVDAGFSSENGEIGEVLKNLARNSLPDYMVPAAIMQLDNIPLTANGKVDRKALPDSNFQSHSQDEYVAPETEVEQKLCAIWQQLLGLEQVGTVERFFEVGGQSLLATRLVSLIFAEFSVEVSIKELFYAQTVREQAGLVEEQLNMQLLLDDLDSLSESELDAQLKLLEQLDS
jgi:iturin family lipopeptide synthetase A